MSNQLRIHLKEIEESVDGIRNSIAKIWEELNIISQII